MVPLNCWIAVLRAVYLELAWVWSNHSPTTRLDSVSKVPTITAVTTISVKKTQCIHAETINTKHDKIFPLHTRLSQGVKYSVNLFTQLNNYGITKH